ncbi:MAG: hypothetical protein HXL32_05755 [Prevotellaceae bacterium]|nr:hypothetical protein [Prevotellaceae bacterium]
MPCNVSFIITHSPLLSSVNILPLRNEGHYAAVVNHAFDGRHTTCSTAVSSVADGRRTLTLALFY